MNECPLARVEREILMRYAQGWTRRRIAKEQAMSVRMVAYTLQRIRDRIGGRTSCAAAVIAVREGWI